MPYDKHNTKYTKVLIIGSGPAGASASIYTARAGLSPIMLCGMEPGGQLTTTTDVENYPGLISIQGPEMMDKMIHQAKKVGTEVVYEYAKKINIIQNGENSNSRNKNLIFSNIANSCLTRIKHYFEVRTENLMYIANVIVVATGAQAKWLGLESENTYKGFGVSSCATCDGFFFKNQQVIVVGGGNTAVEEALYLSKLASKVILIHRRDKLRAEKVLQNRLFDTKNIEIVWNSRLIEVLGKDNPKTVTGAKIQNIITNDITNIDTSGIFIAIGHKPNTSLCADILDTDDDGYIITHNNSTSTNIPGIFAAGDVQDKIYRQAVTAAASGCMAALEAEKLFQ